MTLEQLFTQLKSILEVHPDSKEATVWGVSEESGHSFQVKAVGYDKKHKPNRIKLED